MVGAIVLAAGGSRRMGRPKALLPIEAGTVLSTIAVRLLSTSLDRLVIVLGHEATAVQAGARLPEDPRLRVAINSDWAEGMSSSLRAGLAASQGVDAVVVALGDQPGIDPAVVSRLQEAWQEGARIAAVSHAGRLTHPILFDGSLFPELRLLQGDVGARAIVKAHWSDVVQVEGPLLRDLDTPLDYDAFVAGLPMAKSEGLERP